MLNEDQRAQLAGHAQAMADAYAGLAVSLYSNSATEVIRAALDIATESDRFDEEVIRIAREV